jgi:hypothetical protein
MIVNISGLDPCQRGGQIEATSTSASDGPHKRLLLKFLDIDVFAVLNFGFMTFSRFNCVKGVTLK